MTTSLDFSSASLLICSKSSFSVDDLLESLARPFGLYSKQADKKISFFKHQIRAMHLTALHEALPSVQTSIVFLCSIQLWTFAFRRNDSAYGLFLKYFDLFS